VYLERAEAETIIERFVAVVRSKNASPTWNDVKSALMDFDRVGLRGLVQRAGPGNLNKTISGVSA